MLAPLAMASASRPWPQASWNSVPPKPLASTTGMAPTGAGLLSSMIARLLGGGLRHPAGDLLVDELEAGAAADGLVARLDDVAAAGHHLGDEARARAVVEHEVAERVGDEHPLARVAVADDRLDDLGGGRARGLVAGAHQRGLARDGDVVRAA